MAELSFPTKDTPWTLTEEWMTTLCETYPRLDVEAEVRKARLWLTVNHDRRKTAKGMPRFLVSWLNRASQDVRVKPRVDIPMRRDVWQQAATYAQKRQGR